MAKKSTITGINLTNDVRNKNKEYNIYKKYNNWFDYNACIRKSALQDSKCNPHGLEIGWKIVWKYE